MQEFNNNCRSNLQKLEEGPNIIDEDTVQNTGKPDDEPSKTASLAKTSTTPTAISDKQKESQVGPKSIKEGSHEIANKPDSYFIVETTGSESQKRRFSFLSVINMCILSC